MEPTEMVQENTADDILIGDFNDIVSNELNAEGVIRVQTEEDLQGEALITNEEGVVLN
jgi:hypothetical protein